MLNEFRTQQLPVSVFLVARGAQLLRVEPIGSRFVEFVLRDSDGAIAALAAKCYENAQCSGYFFYRALTGPRYEIDRALRTLRNKGVQRG